MRTTKEFVHDLRLQGCIVVSEQRRVSVKEVLTEEERRSVAAEMANLVRAAEVKEEDIKNVATQMKTELKTIQGQISLDANLISTGYRMIIKPCVVVADFDRKMRLFLDPETGEEVGTEPLQESDYQTRLSTDERD